MMSFTVSPKTLPTSLDNAGSLRHRWYWWSFSITWAGVGHTNDPLRVRTVRELENNPNVEIVQQTGEQYNAAVDRYASRPDQRWSVADCASFLLMEKRGITEALAYDRDFEQAGFVALLRNESLTP